MFIFFTLQNIWPSVRVSYKWICHSYHLVTYRIILIGWNLILGDLKIKAMQLDILPPVWLHLKGFFNIGQEANVSTTCMHIIGSLISSMALFEAIKNILLAHWDVERAALSKASTLPYFFSSDEKTNELRPWEWMNFPWHVKFDKGHLAFAQGATLPICSGAPGIMYCSEAQIPV